MATETAKLQTGLVPLHTSCLARMPCSTLSPPLHHPAAPPRTLSNLQVAASHGQCGQTKALQMHVDMAGCMIAHCRHRLRLAVMFLCC